MRSRRISQPDRRIYGHLGDEQTARGDSSVHAEQFRKFRETAVLCLLVWRVGKDDTIGRAAPGCTNPPRHVGTDNVSGEGFARDVRDILDGKAVDGAVWRGGRGEALRLAQRTG